MAGHRAGVNRGRLIAFEGLDGCGKSTQIAALAGSLRAAGADVVTTCEPTDGAVGQRIRAMARSGERVAPEQELAWFVDDRREHVARVIGPALARGQVVLTDRYYLSTVAYQGARGLDTGALLADSESEFPVPDLVILLEIEPARGLARAAGRRDAGEPVFEEPAFLERVAALFHALDRPYVARVDGDRAEEEVARDVRACVRERLGLL